MAAVVRQPQRGLETEIPFHRQIPLLNVAIFDAVNVPRQIKHLRAGLREIAAGSA